MAINTTHPDYDVTLPAWLRARDVLAGEDSVKAAGEKYLPRLDSQSDGEYAAFKTRASFFGATARTLEEYLDLVFRRAPASARGSGELLKSFAAARAHSRPPCIRGIRAISGWPPPSLPSFRYARTQVSGFRSHPFHRFSAFGSSHCLSISVDQRESAIRPFAPKDAVFRPHFFPNKKKLPLGSFSARAALNFCNEKPHERIRLCTTIKLFSASSNCALKAGLMPA